ncbi:MAG: hypothetical protein IPF47_00090 [Gemmatimonadetes bacterium]|nr:hypothetical protein [Gemmatimonadota bacterium]MBK6844254.1 hypothetical protein [Gemmatimonadota bacterium]
MSEMEHDDRELRERFAALRAREERRAIPPFARVVTGGAPRSARRWRQPAMALGAVAAVAVVAIALAMWRRPAVSPVALVPETTRGPQVADAAPQYALVAGTMRVPTDYFLDVATTVSADEIPTIPSIGSVDWYPLAPAGEPLARPMHDSRRRN